MTYQPKTGARCTCKPGVQRDNCPTCEGTGWVIDFQRIHNAKGPADTVSECTHEWGDITWDPKNSAGLRYADGDLFWFGVCKCGQRVCETFTSASNDPEPVPDEESPPAPKSGDLPVCPTCKDNANVSTESVEPFYCSECDARFDIP